MSDFRLAFHAGDPATGAALARAAAALRGAAAPLADLPGGAGALDPAAGDLGLVVLDGDPEAARAALAELTDRGVPAALWIVGDPAPEAALAAAARADVVCAAAPGPAAALRARGIDVRPLPTGARDVPGAAEPLVARPLPDASRAWDWAVVGPPDGPEAVGLLEAVAARVGPGHVARAASLAEAYAAYRRARVTLVLPAGGGNEPSAALPAATWEVPWVGGCLLQPARPDLGEHLDPAREAATYPGPDALPEALAALLADPERRSDLAARAQTRAWREHLLVHRLVRVVRWLRAAAATAGPRASSAAPAAVAPSGAAPPAEAAPPAGAAPTAEAAPPAGAAAPAAERTALAAALAVPAAAERPRVLVHCERLDNENVCAAVLRELDRTHDVAVCGPGWPVESFAGLDPTGARFALVLDAVSGSLALPAGLEELALPRVAWVVDTHKKPEVHRALSRRVDLTLHAMATWGHVLEDPRAWLPLHADGEVFRPVASERTWDLVFVGSQPWRADPLREIAARHGLSLLVTTTSGPREKSETAALYARARLVFNRHVANDLGFRVFEATLSGRVLLTEAQPNGQYELFEAGRHLVLYTDARDLEAKVLALLADDARRAEIERAAAEHAHRHHTTCARVRELLACVDAFLAERASAAPAPASAAPVPGEPTAPAPGEPTAPDPGEPAMPAQAAPASAEPGASATAEATARATAEEAGPGAPVPAEPSAPAGPAATPADTHAGPPRPAVLACTLGAPAGLDGRTAAERLADALAARGHPAALLRPRATWTDPPARADEATRVELDLDPLPRPADPLQARLDALAREAAADGPLGALLAEGPLGALVAAPVAARHAVPLVLVLAGCEVVRRRNRLTRPQLYLAELEDWACRQADRVLVPSPAVVDALARHYGGADAHVVAVPAAPAPPDPARLRADGARLRARLGVPPDAALVLAAEDRPPADVLDPPDRPFRRPGEPPLLAAGQGLALLAERDPPRLLADEPVTGPALGALAATAPRVVALDPDDLRARDAAAWDLPVSWAPPDAGAAGLRRATRGASVTGDVALGADGPAFLAAFLADRARAPAPPLASAAAPTEPAPAESTPVDPAPAAAPEVTRALR